MSILILLNTHLLKHLAVTKIHYIHIMLQSHSTTGPVRFLSPLRFLDRKAGEAPVWICYTCTVLLVTSGDGDRIIRRTPEVSRAMPVWASCGSRTGISNVFFISYGTRTGPVRDPQVCPAVTSQNVDKPKRRQPKRRQTETSTNRNVDKPKRWQTETSTNQNVDKPKRRQTKTSTDRNVDKPKRRQTKTLTNQNVDKPKRRHSETSNKRHGEKLHSTAGPHLDHWTLHFIVLLEYNY